MNILDLTPYLAIALSAIALLTQIKTMLTSGEKDLDARTSKNESKLIEYDRRIQSIESELKHIPDRETTHRLELSLADIAGRLNTIEATQAGRFSSMEIKLAPIEALGQRLNDVLLEQAKNEHRG